VAKSVSRRGKLVIRGFGDWWIGGLVIGGLVIGGLVIGDW